MRPPSGKKRWHRERADFLLLAAALLSLLCPVAAFATYDPLEEIPVESSLYADLESLALRFGSGGYFLNRRPWTRGEAAAFLEDLRRRAEHRAEHRAEPAADDPSYIRIEREVSLEAAAAGAVRPLWSAEEEGRRFEVSPYAQLLYEENRARRPALNRDYRLGAQVSARAAPHLLFFTDLYAGTSSQGGHGTPNFGTTFALSEGVDLNTWLDRAYIALDNGSASHRLRATLGHSWVRWGPGATGTLGVSDAAPAIDQLRFDAGLLRWLDISWFVASLDAPEQRFYAAHRASVRLGDRLELGVAEEARFDGSDQIFYYLVPGFPYTFIEKRVGVFTTIADTTYKFTKNNAMTSVDFSMRLTPGLRWYGEFLLDDYSFSSTFKPKQIAWQTGAHAARAAGPGRVLSFRAEYTRVYDFVYTVWHKHDFGFGGQTLGYILGPDAEQAWGEVGLDWGAAWRAALEASRIRKGEGEIGKPWIPASGKVDNVPLSGIVERTWRWEAGLSYRPRAGLSIDGKLGSADVTNAEHVLGRDLAHIIGSMGLRARW